jgi:hypothetical protein
MNVNAAAQATLRPLKRLDIERLFQRRWWIVLLLTMGTIVLTSLVRSGAECQYFYRAELDHYSSSPDTFGRPPQLASMPVMTKVMRIVGAALDTVAAWIGWAGGLTLVGLLLGQRELGLGRALRVVAWSWLPFVLRSLVQSVYMGLTYDPLFNAGLSGLIWDNTPPPPGGGYAYVMPTASQRLWAALLSHLDVYLVWQLGLVVSGLHRRAGFTLKKALLATSIVALALVCLGLLPVLFEGTFRQFRLF